MKMETMVPTKEKKQIIEMLTTLYTMSTDDQKLMLAYLQGIQMGQQLASMRNEAV